MDQALRDLTFDDWVTHVFDHPVGGPEWYWAEDAPYLDGPKATTVRYLNRLFEKSVTVLERFSDAQLNQGFWYLVGESSGEMYALLDAAVPATERLACVNEIPPLFASTFAARCSPHLSHLDEAGANPLNTICYMWWDIFPSWGAPGDKQQAAFDRAILSALARILEIPSDACRESALHGLGHWHLHYPAQVASIVEDFLAASPDLRPELMHYAETAGEGCVL